MSLCCCPLWRRKLRRSGDAAKYQLGVVNPIAAAYGFEEIPYSKLEFVNTRPPDRGSYKTVYRARWQGRDVAVLKFRDGTPTFEARMFALLERHPSLICMLGYTVDREKNMAIVTEYAPKGSLDRVIADAAELNVNISNLVLLEMARQVALEKLAHRDLALRNILVFAFHATEHQQVNVRVTDFGLTRDAHRRGQSTAYIHKPGADLPYRWMAPESLRARRWSSKSDVWTMGVLLWELWSGGQIPYFEIMGDQDVLRHVTGGVSEGPSLLGGGAELLEALSRDLLQRRFGSHLRRTPLAVVEMRA
eukprot:jgi/Tetstr1/459829/TSEL_005178.t1